MKGKLGVYQFPLRVFSDDVIINDVKEEKSFSSAANQSDVNFRRNWFIPKVDSGSIGPQDAICNDVDDVIMTSSFMTS